MGMEEPLKHVRTILKQVLKPLVSPLSICNVHFKSCTVFAVNWSPLLHILTYWAQIA